MICPPNILLAKLGRTPLYFLQSIKTDVPKKLMTRIALYLAGGGARGAYQAGALQAIHDILNVKKLPFETISGVSVGSVNAAVLAQNADNFSAGVNQLEQLWANIHCEQIFSTSNYELGKSVLRNLSNLIVKQRQSGYLLSTKPLEHFINNHIQFEKIHEQITAGNLKTMEVISHCYETQQTLSFYQHYQDDFEDWHYARHISQRTNLKMEHILASSALPLFFPTVKVDGFHYGDGSMGLIFPLRGAIRFQVDKILILGTRQQFLTEQTENLRNSDIGFAHVLGSMLNGLFLDNLDRDIEMVNRMNEIAKMISLWNKRYSPWRPIETLHLRPSLNIGALAQNHYDAMPSLLRYLLNVLGAKSHSGDLLSFLLFENVFTEELFTLGYEDTLREKSTIVEFFA